MRKIEIEIPGAPDVPAAGNRYERACARVEAALAVIRAVRELAERADDEYAAASAELAACEKSPGIPLPRYQTPRPGTVPARRSPDRKAN